MPWCEHCRDHFDEDHYDEEGLAHKVGDQYGPVGAERAKARRADHQLDVAVTALERIAKGDQGAGQIAEDALQRLRESK